MRVNFLGHVDRSTHDVCHPARVALGPTLVRVQGSAVRQVRGEDARGRPWQEVLVDDGLGVQNPCLDEGRTLPCSSAVRCSGARRPATTPWSTRNVKKPSSATQSSRSVEGSPSRHTCGATSAQLSTGSSARRRSRRQRARRSGPCLPGSARCLAPRPRRTAPAAHPGIPPPSASLKARGSASARNEVWRSSTSGPSHRGGPWISSIISMPRACMRSYRSSMSSTRGVRWLMWVVVTPPMSAATPETRSSSCVPGPVDRVRGERERRGGQVEERSASAADSSPCSTATVGQVEQLGGNSSRPARKLRSRCFEVRRRRTAGPRGPASR